MKRVLSLLLLIPFLTVQAWALRGGPYDGLNGRSQSALAGMYGVVLSGNVLLDEAGKALDEEGAPVKPVNPETTGIMAMSIPGSGMVSGRILIFAQGLMYLGNAQGIVDQRSGKLTLVSQVSHYVAHLVTDGITRQSGIAVDAILSGKMDLALSLDYFSGLIEVGGTATYFKYDPLLAQVVLDTNTSTALNNAVSNQNKNENQVSNLNSTAGQIATANQNNNQNQIATENANASQVANALQGAATNTSETKSLSQSVASATTNTVTNPDGSTTTTSDSTGTNANNLSGASTNTNAVSFEERNSDLTKGSTVTAGTVKTSTVTEASDVNKGSTVTAGTATTVGTTQNSTNTVTTAKYRPDLIRQSPVASSFMALTAIGVRQDTTVEVLAPFTPPTEATSFQIEVAAPTTGGATGAGAPRPNA